MILALTMNGMIDDDEWWSLTVVQLWIVFAFIVWCGVVWSICLANDNDHRQPNVH